MGKKVEKKIRVAFTEWIEVRFAKNEKMFANSFNYGIGYDKWYWAMVFYAGYMAHKNRERKAKRASKKLVGVLIETPREPTGFTVKEATEAFDEMAKALSCEKEREVPPFQKALKAAIEAIGNAAKNAVKSHNDFDKAFKQMKAFEDVVKPQEWQVLKESRLAIVWGNLGNPALLHIKEHKLISAIKDDGSCIDDIGDSWSHYEFQEKQTRPMTRDEVILFLWDKRSNVKIKKGSGWEEWDGYIIDSNIDSYKWVPVDRNGHIDGEPQKFEVEVNK